MSSGEVSRGQSFEEFEAAERARVERLTRDAHSVLGTEGLEERVAKTMSDYDAFRGHVDEVAGRTTPGDVTHGFTSNSHFGAASYTSPRYSDYREPRFSSSRNPRPPRPRRDFRRLTGPDSSYVPRSDARRYPTSEPWSSRYDRHSTTAGRTNQPERFGWKRVTAAVTAVAATGAAVLWGLNKGGDENAPATAPAAPDSAATVQLAERSLSMYEATSALLVGNKEEITEAEKSSSKISAGDPEMRDALDSAFDYAKANNILENPAAQPEDVFAPNSITDVSLRQRTDTVTYTLKADKALKSMSGYDAPKPEEVERAMGKAPNGAEVVEAHAKEAIDIKQIDVALTEYRTSAKDPEARAKVQAVYDQVDSADLKQKMQGMVQALDAADVLQDLYFDDVTPADVIAFAQTVTDPKLKADLERLANAGDEYDYNSEAYSYSLQLSNGLYDLQAQQFGEDSTNFAIDLNKAKDEQDAINIEAFQATQAAEATFTETLAEEASLEPQPSGPVLVQETDPYEVVDLTELEAEGKVPDVTVAMREEADNQDHPDNFAQFGEVYVEDGQMEVTYQEDLNPAIRKQFDQAIESNNPLLQAAFAGGTLVTVRFVLADDFNPYYNNATREAIIQVAKDDQMTVDQLSTTMTHEIGGHANLRDFFQGVEVSDAEHQALAETCFTLQRLTYETLGGQLSIRPELLANLRAAAKPEHQAAIDILTKAVDEDRLTSLLTDYTLYESTLSNQCDYTGDPSVMLQNAVFAMPDFDISTYETTDLDYLRKSSAYQEFKDAIGLHLEYGSIFSQVVDESEYAMTNSIDKLYMGHSREDANELFASLMDAALNYPDELQANLDKLLNPEEKQAVLDTLSFAYDVLEARAPSLKPLLDGSRQKFGIGD